MGKITQPMKLKAQLITLALLCSVAPIAARAAEPTPETKACIDAINRVIASTRDDAAHMRAMAAKARTDGRADLAAVYERMAGEHSKHVDEQAAVLQTFGARPADGGGAAGSHPADLQHAIAMHTELEKKYSQLAQTETCATAKRLYLVLAVCTGRHLSELKALLPPPPGAALEPVVIFRDREVQVPVERIVERPVERVVERIVERPVERIVERVVVREVRVPARPAPVRVPKRRPAK